MFQSLSVILIFCGYMGLLFMATVWLRRWRNGALVDHPVVYALSLAVYCTSWTYYGSVGVAVSSGMLFLTIYLGPTLCMILWWRVLRKLVRIKDTQRITSIADLVSARYGKSHVVAALATVGALIGSLPYVALQLRSVNDTVAVITAGSGEGLIGGHVGPVVAVLMVLFTIVFGVRQLDPTERHPGMVLLVAVESLVKLAAYLAAGLFVTYGLFDGFGDIFSRFSQSEYSLLWNTQSLRFSSYVRWTSYLILAASAILFLPRQFHVAVVENSRESNIRTAMWFFPLYLLLINLFVMPIAMGGLLLGLPIGLADTFVLRLPLAQGKPLLTILVFLGGFSAATGMIMITSMTMSTMLTNHLLLPLVGGVPRLGFLRRHLLRCRWVAVALFVGLSYGFERSVGQASILVDIGIMAFAAALQFAPAILAGMYWRQANRTGCILGMSGGFMVWIYTMLLPATIESSWVGSGLLREGPWGAGWLRPEGLFGLQALDPVSHTVFWSLLANVGLLVLGSLWSGQNRREQEAVESFLSDGTLTAVRERGSDQEANISLDEKLSILRTLLRDYFSPAGAETVLETGLKVTGLEGRARISILELSEFHGWIEKSLAGALGSAVAHRAMLEARVFNDQESGALTEAYGKILAQLRISPEELNQRIDYYKERERLLLCQSEELEQKVCDRTFELENAVRELEEFSYTVSHDLRSPLRSINGFSLALLEDYGDTLDDRAREYLSRVRMATHRMGELIDTLLQLVSITRADMVEDRVDLSRMADAILEEIRTEQPERTVETVVEPGLEVRGDQELLRALLANLLYNAWKFTSKNDRARVEFRSLVKDGERIFVIKDNGVGFDMAYAHKRFGPFKQLHAQQDYGGAGIGLAIVQRVVKRHGGRIWAEGEPGQGASFSFTLHDRQGANDDARQDAAPG